MSSLLSHIWLDASATVIPVALIAAFISAGSSNNPSRSPAATGGGGAPEVSVPPAFRARWRRNW